MECRGIDAKVVLSLSHQKPKIYFQQQNWKKKNG